MVIFLMNLFVFLAYIPFSSLAINVENRTCIVPENKIPIHIRSIMTRENEQESAEFSVMLEAAAKHVNNIDGILDGYHICFRYDHAGGTQQSMEILYEYIYNEPPILMIFGPPYSSVSTLLNPAVSQFNIVQVTTSTSSLLKDRSRYPLTVQIYPVADDINPGRVGVIKLMKWKRVAILFQDNKYFRANMRDLIQQLEEADIKIVTIEAVSDVENPDQHILSLLSHDARIIILAFYDTLALSFACKAYEYGLYGPKYVMILPGWFLEANELWHHFSAPCNIEEVVEVYETSLYVHTIRTVDNIGSLDFNGVKPTHEQEVFFSEVDAYNIISMNIKRIYYDGILLIALALNSSIDDLQRLNPPRTLDEFNYEDTDMVEIFNFNVRHAEFTGISGLMKTNVTRDRSGMRLYISQYRDRRSQLIFYMDRDGETPTWPDENLTIRWKGDIVPVDGKTYYSVFVLVGNTNRIIVFMFTSMGICLSLFFLAINIWYRNERAIKITSPVLNNFIVFGCILIYASVYVLGLDHSNYEDFTLSALCHVQYVLVAIGFTLAMGALFMKTYRVHAIFTNSTKGIKVKIHDYELILWIIGLVALDIVICVLWTAIDKMFISHLRLNPQLDLKELEKEIYHVPVLRRCESHYQVAFLGTLAATKGVLLLFGVFLAWKTRNVAISALNDSKYIAASVYTIAIVVILLTPALTATLTDVNTQFILFGFAVIIAMTIVLALVFLPKIVIFWKLRQGIDMNVSTMAGSATNQTSDNGNMTNSHSITSLASKLVEKQKELLKIRSQLEEYC